MGPTPATWLQMNEIQRILPRKQSEQMTMANDILISWIIQHLLIVTFPFVNEEMNDFWK